MKTSTRLLISAYKEKYRIQKEKDEKQLELLAVRHRMTGLSKSGTELTPEQENSSKPMPTTVSPTHDDQKFLGLMERADELEREIDFLELALRQTLKIDRLDLRDQQMMHELYHGHRPVADVAHDFGFEKKAMYRHLYGALDAIT
ncbi:hypothetical protein [uncultured Faecalibaculum sp.]|uniref:hypothetical protein n=1 Tax=uncultured Faecalibaculum sp. TaxID=1729681 RepID=UPI0025F1A985|nr:hypothetical protein [uncultured Faecalibaculum sp.]